MNKILLSILAVAATMFSACTSDENATPQKTITLSCDISGDNTRTSFDGGNDYSTLDKIPFKWTDGDKIVVWDGTKVVEAEAKIDANNPRKASFDVTGLNTDDGTEYTIFYGSKKAEFKSSSYFRTQINPEQIQSGENNSDHIHTYPASGSMGSGDLGYATLTLPNKNFTLQHKVCYMVFCLKKNATTTDNIKVNSIKIQGSTSFLIAGNGSTYLKTMLDGTLQPDNTGDRYFQGVGGRSSSVTLNITNPIELTSDYKYAFITFAPYDNPDNIKVTYNIERNGVSEVVERTIATSAFVSGQTYRMKKAFE